MQASVLAPKGWQPLAKGSEPFKNNNFGGLLLLLSLGINSVIVRRIMSSAELRSVTGIHLARAT